MKRSEVWWVNLAAGRLTNADMWKAEHAVKVQVGLLDPALET